MIHRKILIIALYVFCTQWVAGQEAFFGSWEIQEFIKETRYSKDTMSSAMLSDEGLVWDMVFESDGSFIQQSNLNAEKRMDKMSGKWKIESNERLTILLDSETQKAPIKFFYDFREDELILERYDQLRTVMILVTMRKKTGE